MTDPFAAPTAKAQEPTGNGGNFVPLSAMVGRLVLILPTDFERSVKSEFKDRNGNEQYGPKLVADIAVLTGEPEFYWQNKDGEDQEHEADEIPIVFEGVWIQSAPLVDKTEDARRTDLPATMTIGRLVKPKAYGLKDPNEKDTMKAREWLATDAGKAFRAKAQEQHELRVKATKSAGSETNATPFK